MKVEDKEESKETKLLGVRIPENVLEEFKILAIREREPMQNIVSMLIKNYVNEHGDGNPVFKLDHWLQDGDFNICPAFFRPLDDWESYLKNCTEAERQRFKEQLIGIDKRFLKVG